MKKRGFSLIELLAVIIILGVLMLIAVPSVTNYINNSRKEVYVNTGKELIKGASHLVTKGKIDIDDTNTTYYIPYTCIDMDKDEAKSPYGDLEEAYVVVTVNEDGNYDYYFYSRDTEGIGIYPITEEAALSAECIRTGIDNLSTNIGIGRRKNVKVYNNDCSAIEMEKKATKRNPEVDEYGNIVSNDKHAQFIQGISLNSKLKRLANGDSASSSTDDLLIKEIVRSETEPSEENKQSRNKVSTSNSEVPIYMWFDDTDGTMYWWTEADYPMLYEESSFTFYRFRALKYLDLSEFDSSNVVRMTYMIASNDELEYVDLDGFDTSNCTQMDYMFYGDVKLRNLDLSEFDTSKVYTMMYMFWYCKNMTELDLTSFDTSNAINLSSLISGMDKLTSVKFGKKFDTSNVKNFSFFMANCPLLTDFDISKIDLTSATDIMSIFYNLDAIEYLDLSHLNTSNITSFFNFVAECDNLKRINLTGIDTSSATSLTQMFSRCRSLEEVDVSGFDTSNVTSFNCMFYECESLKTLDLSSFDTSNARAFEAMFRGATNLKTIYVSNKFVINEGANCGNIFLYCRNLVGGAGTVWKSSMANGPTYARVDDPENDKPGLFTLKTV